VKMATAIRRRIRKKIKTSKTGIDETGFSPAAAASRIPDSVTDDSAQAISGSGTGVDDRQGSGGSSVSGRSSGSGRGGSENLTRSGLGSDLLNTDDGFGSGNLGSENPEKSELPVISGIETESTSSGLLASRIRSGESRPSRIFSASENSETFCSGVPFWIQCYKTVFSLSFMLDQNKLECLTLFKRV